MEGLVTSKYSDGIFDVSPTHGFLPIKDPMAKLSDKYHQLQFILDSMPININNSIKGMLHHPSEIQVCIQTSLTNYIEEIKSETDPFVIQALYRAYTFLASAFLLEPAYQTFCQTGVYGKALNNLPSNVSVPLFYLSKKLDVNPYQDYHYSYALGNYVKIDPSKGLEWTNLKLAVSYSGTSDEVGFIMTHVDINSFGKYLIESIHTVLHEVRNPSHTSNSGIIKGLRQCYDTMITINTRRMEMWKASSYKNYNNFRIFIMGSKDNEEIFGNGVVYEGISTEPLVFRGQTGAQDDIIPTVDIFTQLIKYYPDNVLTKYLMNYSS